MAHDEYKKTSFAKGPSTQEKIQGTFDKLTKTEGEEGGRGKDEEEGAF